LPENRRDSDRLLTFSKGRKEPRLLLALLLRGPGELCLHRRQKMCRRSTCRTSHPYPPHQAGRLLANLSRHSSPHRCKPTCKNVGQKHLSNPQTSPDGILLLLVPTVLVRARTGQRSTAPPHAPRSSTNLLLDLGSSPTGDETLHSLRRNNIWETVKQAHGEPSPSRLKDDNTHGMGRPLRFASSRLLQNR